MFPPLGLAPFLASRDLKKVGDIQDIQVPVATLLRERKHDALDVVHIGHKASRTTVEVECIESREEESKHHLEGRHCSVQLWHNKDKAFRRRLHPRVHGDPTFQLYQSGFINERFRLGINRVCRVHVRHCRDWLCLFGLLRFIELDVSRDRHCQAIIGGLLHQLPGLLELLLVWWVNNKPASPPGRTRAESYSRPILVLELCGC